MWYVVKFGDLKKIKNILSSLFWFVFIIFVILKVFIV